MQHASNVTQSEVAQAVQLNVRVPEALKMRAEHARIAPKMSLAEVVTAALEAYLPTLEAPASGGKSAPGGPGAQQSNKHIGGEGTGR